MIEVESENMTSLITCLNKKDRLFLHIFFAFENFSFKHLMIIPFLLKKKKSVHIFTCEE